jgi:glutaredoxin
MTNRLTLISRSGCHLCDVAEQALERIAADTGEQFTKIDVDGSAELERDYGDRVPVLLLDGREHGYWRIEEERLLRDLASPPGTPRL